MLLSLLKGRANNHHLPATSLDQLIKANDAEATTLADSAKRTVTELMTVPIETTSYVIIAIK
jgi:hypothetical protein